MKVKFLGHSSFIIETGEKRVLFDPYISMNEKASNINIDEINPDYILLSHGHGDHIADAEQIAKGSEATIVSNYEIVSWFESKGMSKTWPLNHGGAKSFDFGLVKYVNAVHSSVLPDGTYGGNPGGFIIQNSEGRIYYAGDTALHMDMELIGKYWTPKIAFLPIGDNFTMGIEDAILAAKMIRCEKIIGMHYNTFPFIEIDTEHAKRRFSEEGIELILFGIGEEQEF